MQRVRLQQSLPCVADHTGLDESHGSELLMRTTAYEMVPGTVGTRVGSAEGRMVGAKEGAAVGARVGNCEGLDVTGTLLHHASSGLTVQSMHRSTVGVAAHDTHHATAPPESFP